MSHYWTGKLAEKLQTRGIVISPYTTQLKKDSLIAMSGITNSEVIIEFSRHLTFCDFTRAQPTLTISSPDGKAQEPIFEYIHIAPKDKSYLEIIGFHEDPVEIEFEGDGTCAFATARHLHDRASSIDVLAREIARINQQNQFQPINAQDLTFHWVNRWAHYVKHFGTKQSR